MADVMAVPSDRGHYNEAAEGWRICGKSKKDKTADERDVGPVCFAECHAITEALQHQQLRGTCGGLQRAVPSEAAQLHIKGMCWRAVAMAGSDCGGE